MWHVVRKAVSKMYKDPDWLEEKYWNDRLSARDMADIAGCSNETILRYMREYDIPRRDKRKATSIGKRRQHGEYVPFRTHGERGYEYWRGKYMGEDEGRVAVHRLAAVAWFGYDAVEDNAVHHKMNIPWLNAEWNLEPMDFGEHMELHENWKHSPIQDWD